MQKQKGYYGFPSRKAYEEHYSDPAKYADEIPAMEQYAREADLEHECRYPDCNCALEWAGEGKPPRTLCPVSE